MTNFDERAKDWDSDPKKVERARTVADAIRKAIPLSREMTALEYGCGTGLLSFALQEELGQITLADTSQGMLDVLAEKISTSDVRNMKPLRLDLSTDPLPDERYAITYSLMTLHHIHNTQDILKKFHALLEPGGYLLVADLDKEDGSFHTDGTTDIHKGFARSELQKQVEAAGFEEIAFFTAYTIKKKIEEKEKFFPVFLMSARKRSGH
ncbi:MAG: class I SAM-dependent methyltransferase [Anaerolineales bacterium]|uniref:class I SAM-dependent methyltransferase n=1 Tax=Candidatus Villigracilis affinis TaxID=3140682 RepID=UPI002A1B990D|nr:class I SAM-dependent methyltransferase [Anaerolineales bacterium]MBL0345418.1 class I SAM-dependent methyltransferase [Anaerolineales bacterium]